MEIELVIQNGEQMFLPVVAEGIVWKTAYRGLPGELTFRVLKDSVIDFKEGNGVSLRVDGKEMFYGYVFTKKRDKERIIEVTAFDQLRYLKNKDTYLYTDKTASEFISMVAMDFQLKLGEIADSGFKIASRVEENTTLMDMIQNALDLTYENQKKRFILYDAFGKLTLQDTTSMELDLLIDGESGENLSYISSIDHQTYNKVKLVYSRGKKSKRDIFLAQNHGSMERWGVLQYYDTLTEGENGKEKAEALLALYNKRTRYLSLTKVFGHSDVRAGCTVMVLLNLGDLILQCPMFVEKCAHTFKESEHWMDLTLTGGEFIA